MAQIYQGRNLSKNMFSDLKNTNTPFLQYIYLSKNDKKSYLFTVIFPYPILLSSHSCYIFLHPKIPVIIRFFRKFLNPKITNLSGVCEPVEPNYSLCYKDCRLMMALRKTLNTTIVAHQKTLNGTECPQPCLQPILLNGREPFVMQEHFC